ncbi:uncharacterized protein B0H64DRAFT_464977 [Chaetomium fimeti]|uniref:Uncharacterized protein n=1 Tax=Chaetomium fimeti TaxID=1854472 RepID=A0AAE0HB30_9PEZI|nr:hypothetical protein B0H64DRAFT_464977 [Chaetomium fimeti]
MDRGTTPGWSSHNGQRLHTSGMVAGPSEEEPGEESSSDKEPNPDAEFLVGIDLGTTCSGTITGAGTSSIMAGEFIYHDQRLWPGTNQDGPSAFGFKIPTRIACSDHSHWGFQVRDDEPSFEWFKLCVPHEDEVPEDILNAVTLADARSFRQGQSVKVMGVLEAYLRGLWAHCLESIAFGEGLDVEEVRMCRIYVVIGIPANWKSRSRDFLLEAARNAGIPGLYGRTTIETCVEPVAAAIALLEQTPNIESMNLTAGDIFTVLDAGGGTSDTATFKIHSRQPTSLQQCVPPGARFCGPVQVERLIFERFFKKVEAEAEDDRAATLTDAEIQPLFRKWWYDSAREAFKSSKDAWAVDVPDHLIYITISKDTRMTRHMGRQLKEQFDRRADRGRVSISFTGDELKELMGPTIEKMVELVQDQFTAALAKEGRQPRVMFVCGGFSQNLYVRARLEEEIRDWNAKHASESDPIEISFADSPLNVDAVSKGCARYALELRCRSAGTGPQAPSPVAQHAYRVRGDGQNRGILAQGALLAADQEPLTITLERLDFTINDLPFGRATATLKIEEDNCPLCEMWWTNAGAERLIAALNVGPRVSLGVRHSGHGIYFTAYIGGDAQAQGNDFDISYVMEAYT